MRLSFKLFKLKTQLSFIIHSLFICPIKGHSMDTINFIRIGEWHGEVKCTSVFCSKCQREFNYYEVE